MRILILTPECPPCSMGGIGRYVYEVSKELAAMCELEILVVPTYQLKEATQFQPFDSRSTIHNTVSWHYLSSDGLQNALQKKYTQNSMKELLDCSTVLARRFASEKKETYDAVYVQEYSLAPLAYVLKQDGTAKEIIGICHLPLYAGFTYFDRTMKDDCQQALESVLVRLSHYLIVPSAFTKSVLCRIYNIQPARVLVIPHGVRIIDGKRNPDWTQNMKIGTVVRYTEQKGLHYLLCVLNELRWRNENYCFKMIGSGPGRARFERMIDEAGLTGAVEIMDRKDESNVYEFYQDIDFYISTSLYETFGLALLEAMACGCVPVAFDVSAISELLGELSGRLSVPVGDINSFVTTMTDHWHNKKKMTASSHRCLLRARQFSWNTHAAALWKTICEGVKQ